MKNLNSITDLLCSNTYPGRGIIAGRSDDGENAVVAYFIMGRSENSRNRIFVAQGDGLRTEAFDPSKLSDPSLIIYAPVRVLDNRTIVTNGDQTDTIFEYEQSGRSFEDALRTRTFEPDAPNYTPRISAELITGNGMYSYKLSILKSSLGCPDGTERFFYEYDAPQAGEGRFIHTYRCDGDPIPSFSGDPEPVKISGDIDSFANSVWNALNEQNRVSLFVRYIPISGGETNTRIINKNK